MIMSTKHIISEIQKDFARVCKPSSNFAKEFVELWDFCMKVIADPVKMQCIEFNNSALKIPPVKTLLAFYMRENQLPEDFSLTEQQRKDLGALWRFVFRNVLGYRSQVKRVTVNLLGAKTATRYTDCPVIWEFCE